METKEQEDFLSQKCSNCDGSLVTCWCLDCNGALCDGCVLAHRRVTLTRSHRLLNQPQNDYNLVSPIKFCRLHPSEPLQLFCFTCKQLTCRDCQLTAHRNHRFNFFSKVMDYLRKQLDNSMQPIKAQIEASRKSLQDMETRLLFLAQCEFRLTNSLQEIFNTLARLLKARSDRLIKEIKKMYNLEREMINGRMLKVKQMQEGHRSVSEAAAKAQNTMDLPLLVNDINQIRSQVKDLVNQDSSPPPHMIYLKVITDQKTVEGMLNFGKLLYSWIPFSVSQEYKEKVEAPLASSSSSSSLTSQPLTCITTTSNSVHVSSPGSPPGSHKTGSRTTSSSLDLSSSLSTSSSKTSLQTGTSRDSASSQSWPSLPTSSDLLPSPAATHSSTLTCSSPSSGPFTRTGKNSGVPAAIESSPSVSPSTQLHLHPSSTCPPPSSSIISQTGDICDLPKSSASMSSMAPPSSSFRSPDPTEPVPKTTTPETSTPVSISLIPTPSQPTFRHLGSPLFRCPSCACFHSTSYSCPSQLHQVLNNPNHLLPSTSSLVFPHSSSPLHLAATKGPETPAIKATPTESSDSTIRINILTKSQLESNSGQLHFKFRWKNKKSSSKSSSSIRSFSPVGSKAASVRCKNKSVAASLSPQTSLSPTTTNLPILVGHLVSSSCIVSSSPTSSTCPASVNKDPPKTAPSAVHWVNVQPASSILPPASPSLDTLKPDQSSLVLDQLPVVSQNQCAVDLLTNPQVAPPLSSAGTNIFSSFISDPPSSSTSSKNVSNHAQPLAVLNHEAVPGQNQPTVAPLTNPKTAYLMSGSSLSLPPSPQLTVLQNDFTNHSIPTVQESSDSPQFSPVLLGFQAVPTTTLGGVGQGHSVPTNQQTPTNGSCAAPDKQLLSDQNSASNSGPGPSPLNEQKQNLGLKMMADLNRGVQDQEPQQEHKVDTNTSVSESVAVEFGEPRREEELSSAETAVVKRTSVLPEETDPAVPYEVTPNIDSEEIKTFGGPFSPVSSEENHIIVPPEETKPAGRQNPLKISKIDPVTLQSEEMELYGGPFSPISSEEEITIVLPEETDPAGKQPTLAIVEVEDANVESEALRPFGGPFSPVSSEDDLIIVSPEEMSPTGKQCSHKVHKIESDTIKSEDMEPYGGPFSPVSSEDEITIVSPGETSPTGKQSSHKVESDTIKSEDMEPYGRPFSPVSSEDEITIVRPVQTNPEGKQPTSEISEVKPTVSSGPFSPVSSEDALTPALTEAPHFALNLDETSDSESEEPQSFRTEQRDFSESQWQPTVSLVRLPVSRSGRRRPPSVQIVLGDKKDELYLQESHVDVVSDVDSDNGSDITEDFTMSLSSESPMSVEIISCSACASANASKICSVCGRGYHINCHVPPAGPDIWSEWTCSLCQDLSDPSDPYNSERPKSPDCTGLSLQDRRRCETLLLHLKVEGCRQSSQRGLWSDVTLISERLTHRRPPPYQTAAQLVSDLWTVFQDASQDEELTKLQASFQRKLMETLGQELPLSLLIAPASTRGGAGGPISSVSSARNESEVVREEEDFKEVRKRLRDFLDLKVSSAFKRTKKQ